MNDHDEGHETPDTPWVGELLTDAVADVEPADRLAAIRASTSRARRTRRAWYAGGSTLVAAAATVAAFAVIGPRDDTADPDTDPAEVPSTSATAVYYVGPPSSGPDAPEASLYRYFAQATGPLPLLMETPEDPDYRTLWPEGSLVDLGRERDVITVDLADDSLRLRPDGVSEREARLAVEQVVYTVQAYFGGRPPVQFRLDGNPIDQVYGVPTAEPIANGPQLDVLSHLMIDDPTEGMTYDRSFTAQGLSNGVEASVACWIYAGDDGGAWGPYVGTAEGWLEERLFPWRVEVDLNRYGGVPPGTYSFECSTDDPTGGAEGSGAYTDTRTITVE